MATIRRLVLDVLKAHKPNALEFATTLAELGTDYRIKLTVTAVDEKTESTILIVEGREIEFEPIADAIKKMGASVHSIDEVEVEGSETTET